MSGSEFEVTTDLSIKLRAAKPEHEPFLLKVYASTRADEMALAPGSEEQRQEFVAMQFAAQQKHYVAEYPNASHDIILADDRAVGRLYVARLDEDIRIIDITILTKERNRGIGTYLIGKVLEEAASTTRSVSIYVETFNPSLRLFERLGFIRTEQAGINFLLKWTSNGSLTEKAW